MRSDRQFKTFLYWIILIAYIVGIYMVWLDFKKDLEEAKNAKEEFIIRE